MSKIKFAIGDKISSQRHGNGVVINVDPNSWEWRYNVRFEDGTGAWISGRDSKKLDI